MASKAQYDAAVKARDEGRLTVYVAKLKERLVLDRVEFGVEQLATRNELEAAEAVAGVQPQTKG